MADSHVPDRFSQGPRPTAPPAPVACLVLMGACGLAFIATWVYSGDLSVEGLLYRPIDLLTLISCGAKDRQLILAAGEWWRLLSAGFLHGHVLHLAVNLYALWVLGSVVERLWDTRRFLIIYVVALASGSGLSLAATPRPSVGASGAVFGLFGALVVFSVVYRHLVDPRRRVALWVNLAVIAAINVGLGLALPFIDNAAHAGGFAGGALAALVLRPVPVRREGLASEMAVRGACVLAVVATVWSLVSAVQFAATPETRMLVASEMERRTLEKGAFELYVPKGWTYEAPEPPYRRHVFERQGAARIVLLLLPRDQTGSLSALAESEADALRRGDATLLATRDTTVGDNPGLEMHFRVASPIGPQRFRIVVFATHVGRNVSVTCICPERKYPLMEVVFDKIIQSIRPRLPEPQASKAQELWQRLIEDPADAEAYVLLAATYRLEGRLDAAEQALRTAIRLRPDYADAHDQLAYLYATAPPSRRQPREAIVHAQKAIELAPQTPRYHATMAIACKAAGDRVAALAAARRAAALAPDDASYADLVKRLSAE